MFDWSQQTQRAREWFEALRDRICAEFEAIEREAGSEAAFDYLEWQREEEGNPAPGGGVRGVMKGKVFEKVGVNVSTVSGEFAPGFAQTIHGADQENPGFTATGISLVAHMANPHVPAVHMNTRFLTTSKAWFGGGADLNPPIPYAEDTEEFHAAFRAACMAHNPTYYDKFRKWADEYFFIPHRGVARGVGGIFYDHLECADETAWERNFASPATSARRSSRSSPRSSAAAWAWTSRPRRRPRRRNGAAATPSSTSSTTAARCSASRPAATSTLS